MCMVLSSRNETHVSAHMCMYVCVWGVHVTEKKLLIFLLLFFTCNVLGSHNTGHEDELFYRMICPVVFWIFSIISEEPPYIYTEMMKFSYILSFHNF
jgi:hypothetical protein